MFSNPNRSHVGRRPNRTNSRRGYPTRSGLTCAGYHLSTRSAVCLRDFVRGRFPFVSFREIAQLRRQSARS